MQDVLNALHNSFFIAFPISKKCHVGGTATLKKLDLVRKPFSRSADSKKMREFSTRIIEQPDEKEKAYRIERLTTDLDIKRKS